MSGTVEQRDLTVAGGGGGGGTGAATAVTATLARLVGGALPEIIRAAKVRFLLFSMFLSNSVMPMCCI